MIKHKCMKCKKEILNKITIEPPKDWDNKEGENFSEVVYNHISINYDLTIFYDSPGLAKELF